MKRSLEPEDFIDPQGCAKRLKPSSGYTELPHEIVWDISSFSSQSEVIHKMSMLSQHTRGVITKHRECWLYRMIEVRDWFQSFLHSFHNVAIAHLHCHGSVKNVAMLLNLLAHFGPSLESLKLTITDDDGYDYDFDEEQITEYPNLSFSNLKVLDIEEVVISPVLNALVSTILSGVSANFTKLIRGNTDLSYYCQVAIPVLHASISSTLHPNWDFLSESIEELRLDGVRTSVNISCLFNDLPKLNTLVVSFAPNSNRFTLNIYIAPLDIPGVTKLRSLELHGCTKRLIHSALRYECSSLTHLSLYSFISDQDVNEIVTFPKLNAIESLSLNMSDELLVEKILNATGTSLQKLYLIVDATKQDLTVISTFPNLNQAYIKLPAFQCNLIQNSSELKQLRFEGTGRRNVYNITPSYDVIRFTEVGNHLNKLTLDHVSFERSNWFHLLVSNMPQLTHLKVSYRHVVDPEVHEIPAYSTCLRYLCIKHESSENGMIDGTFATFIQNSPDLETIIVDERLEWKILSDIYTSIGSKLLNFSYRVPVNDTPTKELLLSPLYTVCLIHYKENTVSDLCNAAITARQCIHVEVVSGESERHSRKRIFAEFEDLCSEENIEPIIQLQNLISSRFDLSQTADGSNLGLGFSGLTSFIENVLKCL